MKQPRLRKTCITCFFVCLGLCAICGGLYFFLQLPYQCPDQATKGNIIVFGAYQGDPTGSGLFAKRSVCLVDINGMEAKIPAIIKNVWRTEMEWSPDDRWVVYSTAYELTHADGISEIYLMRSDGSNQPVQITSVPVSASEPTWSPDGTQIAYNNDGEKWGIYLLNVECVLRNQPCVFSPKFLIVGSEPDWSPDGKKIVYNGYPNAESKGGIFVLNVDGSGQPTLVSPPGQYCHEPQWSLTGSAIATYCNDGIYTFNADGTNPKLLVKDGYSPRWSPDGKQLAFTGGQSLDSRLGREVGFSIEPEGGTLSDAIFLINVDGTDLRRLTAYNYQAIDMFRWLPKNILDPLQGN